MDKSLFSMLKSLSVNIIIFSIPVVGIIYLFPFIFKLISPFLLAFILYSLSKPLNHFLRRFHFNPSLSALLSLLIVASVFCYVVWLIFSSAISELQGLSLHLSDIYTSATKTVQSVTTRLSSIDIFSKKVISPQITQSLLSQFSKFITSFTASLLGYAKNVAGIFVVVFTSFFICFFMLKDKNLIISFLKNSLSKNIYEALIKTKKTTFSVAGKYLKAQLLMVFTTFLLLLIGFFILKVEYTLLLAFLISLVDAIPVLGTGTILIPWAVISLISKNSALGWGLLSLYGVCALTRQIAEPKIIGNKLGIHPLISIISIYIGVQLFGLWGLIIGPISAVLLKNFLPDKNFR